MSIFHDSALIGSGGGAVAYQINQSLRFKAANSSRLTRTPGTSGNRRTWTLSMWVKKWGQGIDGKYMWAAGVWSSGNPNTGMFWTGPDKISTTNGVNGVNNDGGVTTSTAVYRDPSAWMHLVFRMDTANATLSNRHRVYVNGQLLETASSVTQNFEGAWNHTVNHALGGNNNHGTYSDVFLAEVYNIDGQSLGPESFGETDTITGAWIPKKYSGSYGTNGFYLKFDPSATNGIGHDHSGNGNNFTPSGFVTSGFESDCMVDTPTSNHPTINPVGNTAGNVFTQGNLEIADTSGGGNWQGCQATIPFPTTGKWYYEMRMGGGTSNIFFGISSDAGRYASIMHDHADTFAIRQSDCDPRPSGATTTGTKSGYGYNDIAGIAVNCDTGVIQFYKNGSLNVTFVTTFDPAKIYFASFMSSATGTQTMYFNFGAQGFTYTPPTGYKALNTANLPEPTIKKGSTYFNTVAYSGSSSNQAITVGFEPDFLWIKRRNGANDHNLYNAIVGLTGNYLVSNSTGAENSNNSRIVATSSTGFTVGTGSADTNGSGNTYVAWAWDANGAGSSNTAGSITSTVSANATAGFSIVTYTGAGSNGTVGHGLGVAPKFLIVKNRSSATAYNWYVWHAGLTSASYFLNLNRDIAQTFSADPFNGTAPTSTVFSVGGENRVSSVNYVAYCFSEVAGYSKFGSYTGNGSSDGPFVFCGFKPQWILVKASSVSGYSWICLDTQRDSYNVSNKALRQNLSDVELANTLSNTDLLSNGFKLRTTWADMNSSGTTYIFAAFAELPFKYANAR